MDLRISRNKKKIILKFVLEGLYAVVVLWQERIFFIVRWGGGRTRTYKKMTLCLISLFWCSIRLLISSFVRQRDEGERCLSKQSACLSLSPRSVISLQQGNRWDPSFHFHNVARRVNPCGEADARTRASRVFVHDNHERMSSEWMLVISSHNLWFSKNQHAPVSAVRRIYLNLNMGWPTDLLLQDNVSARSKISESCILCTGPHTTH